MSKGCSDQTISSRWRPSWAKRRWRALPTFRFAGRATLRPRTHGCWRQI